MFSNFASSAESVGLMSSERTLVARLGAASSRELSELGRAEAGETPFGVRWGTAQDPEGIETTVKSFRSMTSSER